MHVHEIANESRSLAAGIHVYSPPLETMHHYELTRRSLLEVVRKEAIDVAPIAPG